MAITNREWQAWGGQDPLFGVASWAGRDKAGSNPWTDEEFYALGADWADFDAHWTRYGRKALRCLEIGCGAGRMTAALARSFDQVVGLDVSEGMIRYAQGHVNADNIRWVVANGERIPIPDGSVDAVFSCHVFQHFDRVAAAISYFREMHRVLSAGASFMVHLPLHQFPDINPWFARCGRGAYRQFSSLARVKADVARLKMRLGGKPYMHGLSFDSRHLHQALTEIGFHEVEFATFLVRPSMMLHSCVLGRR